MYKTSNVRRYNTLKTVISLMHLSLDEKRCTFHMNYIFDYIPLQLFITVYCKNKFGEVLNKDPVTKINTAKFVSFTLAKPEHSLREIFAFLPVENNDDDDDDDHELFL